MEKPVSIYAAYKMVCENSKNKSYTERNEKIETDFDIDGVKHTARFGQGGSSTTRFDDVPNGKHPNSKYSEKVLVSPFCEHNSVCNADSGVFSQDNTTVEAALNNDVPTNKPVQSKFISLGFVNVGAFTEEKTFDYGLVDALTWQCFMGNDMNVRSILKHGYKTPKKYKGLNPLTASIIGKNLQCLKLVLSIPSIKAIVNDKDGFGSRAIQYAATVTGIDPFEFAREIVNAGGVDKGYTGGEYSALMLCLLRNGGGAIWTPNIFGEILQVSDLDYKTKDGETVESLAKKVGNQDAIRMIMNYKKFGLESLNNAVLDNKIGF